MIRDLTIAFSGNVAYVDGGNSLLEAYYDSKAGVYSPNPATSLETARQIAHSPPDHRPWRDILIGLFQQGFGLNPGDFSYDAGTPLVQRTINGMNLRYTINIADTNDGNHSFAFVYQDGLFIITTGITSEYASYLGGNWRDVFREVLGIVFGSFTLPV